MTEHHFKRFSELAAPIDEDVGRRQEAVAARQRAVAEILTHNLAEIRRTRNITQSEIARHLGVGQPRVSRIERGESLHLDTLRAYVHALGGRLEVAAVFDDDERVIIDIGEELRPTG